MSVAVRNNPMPSHNKLKKFEEYIEVEVFT